MTFCARRTGTGRATAIALAAWLTATDASALLLERMADDTVYTVFFPYPTAFTAADPGFAFDDDPLSAIVEEPFSLPREVFELPSKPSLHEPRISFVSEMMRSGDAI